MIRPPPSPFFTPHSSPDETPAPTVSTAHPRTRLEVLHGWEVSFTVLSLYLISVLSLFYILLTLPPPPPPHPFPSPLSRLENLIRIAIDVSSAILALFFCCNLLLHPHVTHEQLWTCVLLLITLIADNPLTAPTRSPGMSHVPPLLNDAVYTAVIYLYLILAAHSYRIFDAAQLKTCSFYLPKLALAAVYLCVKVVAGLTAHVSLGLVPFSRVVAWWHLYRSGRVGLKIAIPVFCITLLDAMFAVCLVREVTKTTDFLARVPYVENRAKQLGFRCFVYQTLSFCFNMIGLSMLITFLTPKEYLYRSFDGLHGRFLQLEPPVARLALAAVYFTWTLVLAYVNLPPRPLMLPLAQRIFARCLYIIRNSRIAVWMGLADLVTAEDAEDSDDERATVNVANTQSGETQVVPDERPEFPFRYCHREVFDDVIVAAQRARPIRSIEWERTWAGEERLIEDVELGQGGKRRNGESSYSVFANYGSLDDTSHTILESRSWGAGEKVLESMPKAKVDDSYDAEVYAPETDRGESRRSMKRQRPKTKEKSAMTPKPLQSTLRLRKNLFVMETQIMMANAAYLSYIPGNVNEERVLPSVKSFKPNPAILYTGSLASNLDDLARQMEHRTDSLVESISSRERRQEATSQPNHDDGTFFLVDPYEMAERYGYRIYKYISDEARNTHAVILVSSDRIVVAFSGTRDVKNWGVNVNISRSVLDDKLSRFEFELSMSPESTNIDATDSELEDTHRENQEFELHETRFGRNSVPASRCSELRKSKSEDELRSYASTEFGIESPLTRSTSVKNYGAIARRAKLAAMGRFMRGSNHALMSHEGVTKVARTYAKEFMTFGQAKVHEGFLDAYIDLRKRVMGALVELYRGKGSRGSERDDDSVPMGPAHALPLFFCGHSMGGALATFASYEAARYYKRIGLRSRHDISCTTFGCPMIGNEAFKMRYERLVETHWRFEIATDPVPKVPLVFLNYVHVGVQVLIDQSGMLLIDPSFIEVQWWGRLSNLYMGYRFHIRASYCMALKTYCKLYKSGEDELSDRFWPFPIRAQTKGLFEHVNRT